MLLDILVSQETIVYFGKFPINLAKKNIFVIFWQDSSSIQNILMERAHQINI